MTMSTCKRGSHANVRVARIACCVVPLCSLLTTSCSSSEPEAAVTGTFSVLTYNVAGLPEGISGSHPAANTPQMSPLLNDYDVVLVQEDFAYHRDLVSAAEHPYQSTPDAGQASLGDGLNLLSQLPFEDLTRTRWQDCFGELDAGSDCLTPKGFFVTRLEIAPGAFVDLYDLHADAGRSPSDAEARSANFDQLRAAIEANSQGNAVIVTGDFNERYSYGDQTLSTLLDDTGLKDVWVELERGSVLPPSPSEVAAACETDDANLSCERIDKVLYRSSPEITLMPIDYRVDSARFVDTAGQPLSDHPPVVAVFDFVAR
jgi:endonuclease/exonuclease/phosphatase family metal-dependent hydrolase